MKSSTSVTLTCSEIDTLVALVERGPLHDRDLPSTVGKNGLLTLGFAAQQVINHDYGYYAATIEGKDWYTDRYKVNNIKDCKN